MSDKYPARELTVQELMQEKFELVAKASKFFGENIANNPNCSNHAFHAEIDKFIIEHLLRQERQIAWFAKELDKFRNDKK